MYNAIIILQGRMGSTRLPGKILKKINGKEMLWYSTSRLQKFKKAKLVIATSTNIENNEVEKFCRKYNINCYRGSEDDVLDRYYQCAKKYNATIIIRVTGDCPLIDINILEKMFNFYNENKYDYICNTWFKNSYPSGFDVEIFSFNLLEYYWQNETDIYKREHVVNSFNNKLFRKYQFTDLTDNFFDGLNFNLRNVHLSVDNEKDFNLIKTIIKNFKDNIDFSFYEVINFLNVYFNKKN